MPEQISEHVIRLYEAAKQDGGWLTSRELAVKADIADRTARAHAARLGEAGVLEVAKVFGGFRYRIRSGVASEGREYVARIEAAKRVMRL